MITLILIFVVPAFTQLFESMNAVLPLPTRIVIGFSKFLGSMYGILLAIGGGIIAAVVKAYYATPPGRYNIDALLLKLPIFGPLLRKIAVARFTQTMATLIASGVPILDCLDITAGTAGNAIVEEAILKVKRSIEEGNTIAAPLQESGVFPSMVVSMIAVGEAAGALEVMLSKIAAFYEEEVDTAVGDIMTAIEPAIQNQIFLKGIRSSKERADGIDFGACVRKSPKIQPPLNIVAKVRGLRRGRRSLRLGARIVTEGIKARVIRQPELGPALHDGDALQFPCIIAQDRFARSGI